MGLDDVDEILEPEHRKQGIVDQVMEKNRKYAKETKDKEEQFDLMQGLNEIAEELGDYLDTRVKIEGSASKGKIVIEYSGGQDLQRIIKEIRS